MPWAAIGSILGGGMSYFGGQSAQDNANQMNQQNIAAQERWNMQQDPFSAGGNRQQYVGQLNDLMRGGYQGAQQDPMFQWMMKQGQNQMQRGSSASGQGGSGAEMAALQQQGFGLANDFFQQQYDRLSSLSGASRGGGSAAIGQSPQAGYNQTIGSYQNMGAGIGMGLQGLGSLFGGGSGGGQSIDPNSQYGQTQSILSGW